MEITLGSIVSYLVGVPVVLLSSLLTIQTPAGFLPLILGLLILPPIRRQLSKRADIEFSRGAAAGIGIFGVIALLIVLVIAAPSSGGGAPGADVSNVSVTAEDASPQEPATSLAVEWNSRAQSAVNPNPDDLSTYNSNEGQKYVVVRVTVNHDGGEPLELTPRMFRLRSGGVEYDYQALFGSGNSLTDVTLNQGGTHSAWVVFSVPEDLTEAELIVNQEAFFDKETAVTFEHNTEKQINVSD